MDVETATDADWTGVCFNKQARRWQASIRIHRRYVYLGCYATRAQAAKAWDLVSLRVRHNTRTNLSRDDYFDQHGNLLSCPVLDDMIQVFLNAEQQAEGAPDQTARGAFCAAVVQAVTGVPAPSDVPAAAQRGAVAKRRRTDPGSTSEPQAGALVQPKNPAGGGVPNPALQAMQQMPAPTSAMSGLQGATDNMQQQEQQLQQQEQQLQQQEQQLQQLEQQQQLDQQQQEQQLQQLLQQELLRACLPQQAPAQAGAAAGGTEWCGAVTSPAGSSAGATPAMLGAASSSPAATDTMPWHCGQPAVPACAPPAAAPPAAAPPAAAPAPFNLPRARLPAMRHGRPQLPIQHQTHQCSAGSSAVSRQLAATLVEQMLGALTEEEQNQLLRDLLGMEPPAATAVAAAAAQTPAAGTTGATAAATGRGAADTAACSAMPHPGAPAGGHQPHRAAGAGAGAKLACAVVTCNSSSSSGSSGQFGQAGQQQQQQKQTQVFNTRLLQGLLPPGSSIEQIRVAGGGIGMFSVIFACWTSSPATWGAQIWDGVCWHSLGTYGCEADAVAASVYVMESVSDACSV